jgi:hypothetical protein
VNSTFKNRNDVMTGKDDKCSLPFCAYLFTIEEIIGDVVNLTT